MKAQREVTVCVLKVRIIELLLSRINQVEY